MAGCLSVRTAPNHCRRFSAAHRQIQLVGKPLSCHQKANCYIARLHGTFFKSPEQQGTIPGFVMHVGQVVTGRSSQTVHGRCNRSKTGAHTDTSIKQRERESIYLILCCCCCLYLALGAHRERERDRQTDRRTQARTARAHLDTHTHTHACACDLGVLHTQLLTFSRILLAGGGGVRWMGWR